MVSHAGSSSRNASVQLRLVDALHKVYTHRTVLLTQPTTSSADASEFYMCLAHLLFMLSVKPVLSPTASDAPAATNNLKTKLSDGYTLVSSGGDRVWAELYLAHKSALEDRCRVALVPEMNAARSLVGDVCAAQWHVYVDAETRGTTRDLTALHAQLQSKIQKVTSSLQRLTSRSRALVSVAPTAQTVSAVIGAAVAQTVNSSSSAVASAFDSAATGPTKATAAMVSMWTRVHVGLIKELVRIQGEQYSQWHEHVARWCALEWNKCEAELTRQRGLWGPDWASQLDKFMLDATEGPNRVRRKLVPNVNFYIDYPYRPALDLPENVGDVATASLVSEIFAMQSGRIARQSAVLRTNVRSTSTHDGRAHLRPDGECGGQLGQFGRR